MDTIFQFLNDYTGAISLFVGLITIFAIFFSPVVALKLQKKIEVFNEKTERKLNVFKTLLATRADLTSLEHVKALNMIDIEFYKEKEITECWNTYRDHLNSFPAGQDKFMQDIWSQKGIDYLTELLFVMSKYFGYDFNKVILQKGAYSPLAHGISNQQLLLIRAGLIKLFAGEAAMKVDIVNQTRPADM